MLLNKLGHERMPVRYLAIHIHKVAAIKKESIG
jgi:hypothetical protein